MTTKQLTFGTLMLAVGLLALAIFASPVSAFELTPGINLDTTFSTVYSIKNDNFDNEVKSELSYNVNPNLSAHLVGVFDLDDVDFMGQPGRETSLNRELSFGVEFTPVKVRGLNISAYSYFDSSFEYTDTELSAAFTF